MIENNKDEYQNCSYKKYDKNKKKTEYITVIQWKYLLLTHFLLPQTLSNISIMFGPLHHL